MELGGIEEDEEVVGSWGFCGGEVVRDGVVVEVEMRRREMRRRRGRE